MVELIITLLMTTAVIVGVVAWVKALADESEFDDYPKQCHGCKGGFCTEEYGSEECKKTIERIRDIERLIRG